MPASEGEGQPSLCRLVQQGRKEIGVRFGHACRSWLHCIRAIGQLPDGISEWFDYKDCMTFHALRLFSHLSGETANIRTGTKVEPATFARRIAG